MSKDKKAEANVAKMKKPVRQVLGTLAKSKGPLTRKQIAAAVAKAGDAIVNGRISQETVTYAGLVKQKYITEIEGKSETVYEITAAGRKALQDAK